MKFKYNATQEEKDEVVRKTILRQAKALHNACKSANELNRCNGCPYQVSHGCKLYEHPISWKF